MPISFEVQRSTYECGDLGVTHGLVKDDWAGRDPLTVVVSSKR